MKKIRNSRLIISILLLFTPIVIIILLRGSLINNTNYDDLREYSINSIKKAQYVSIELKANNIDDYQVFFDIGKGYNEVDSAWDKTNKEKQFNKLYFKIPSEDIKNFRIDLGSINNVVKIKSIEINTINKKYTLDPKKILIAIKNLNQIKEIDEENGEITIKTGGNDPFFELILN